MSVMPSVTMRRLGCKPLIFTACSTVSLRLLSKIITFGFESLRFCASSPALRRKLTGDITP